MRLEQSRNRLRSSPIRRRLAFCCALLEALGLSHSLGAQLVTYGDQASYYHVGSLIPIERNPNDSIPDYDGISAYPQSTASYGGFLGPEESGVASPFYRIIDDINEDGIPGAIVTLDPNTGLLSTMTDFDDLHEFNVGFDQVTLVQRSGMRSFDTAAVYWVYEETQKPFDPNERAAVRIVSVLDSYARSPDMNRGPMRNPRPVAVPQSWPVIPQFTRFASNRREGGGLGIVYGYREFAVRSQFGFEAEGGIMGRSTSETNTLNSIAGPQAGLVAFKRFGPLSFYAHGFAVAGWNDGEVEQQNMMGAELIPGATNRLLYSSPTLFQHAESYNEIVPTGLFWAEAGLQVTQTTSVKLAWSATYLYNVLLAQGRTRYYLPDMGLVDPAEQHLFVHYLFCGIEVVR